MACQRVCEVAAPLTMHKPLLLTSLCLAIAACSSGPEPAPEVAEQGGEPVECALAGAEDFTPECALLPSADAESMARVIQHPDGGFRVFEYGDTKSGLVARDGADQSVETVEGDKVIVAIGGDRYRFDLPGGQ